MTDENKENEPSLEDDLASFFKPFFLKIWAVIGVGKKKNQRIIRPRKRYWGGVCAALGERFNIDPIWIRFIFAVTTVVFIYPLLLYVILWFSFPNFQEVKDKKGKNIYQFVGFFIGLIVGPLIPILGVILYYNVSSSLDEVVVIMFYITIIVAVPLGALLGFMTGRGIIERKLKK